jgi:hypothetical protein
MAWFVHFFLVSLVLTPPTIHVETRKNQTNTSSGASGRINLLKKDFANRVQRFYATDPRGERGKLCSDTLSEPRKAFTRQTHSA